jgi:hypothetical protein
LLAGSIFAKAVIPPRFPFPTWRPRSEVGEGVDKVWLYGTEDRVAPASAVTEALKKKILR